MSTGSRLTLGCGIIVAVTGYLAYLGAASSWSYYVTTDECLAGATTYVGRPIRVSGRVATGSLAINQDRSEAGFVLKGMEESIQVVCAGPLPDNLAEEMDVVVEGRLETPSCLKGEKVLTRCASKYESKAPRTAEQAASTDSEQTRR